MQRTVQLFTLASAPGSNATPATSFTVEAARLDDLPAAARAQLEADGYRVRAVSFTPTGLVAYAEAP